MSSRRLPKHSARHVHTWERWWNPRSSLEVRFCFGCRLDNIGKQWLRWDPSPTGVRSGSPAPNLADEWLRQYEDLDD